MRYFITTVCVFIIITVSDQFLFSQSRMGHALEEKLFPKYKKIILSDLTPQEKKAKLIEASKVNQSSYEPEDNYQAKTHSYVEQKVSNNNFESEGESFLIINKRDTNNIVLSYMHRSSSGTNFPVYYSVNGGITFTKSTFNPLNQFYTWRPSDILLDAGDPVMAFDNNGKLVIAYNYLYSNQNFDTFHKSTFWAYSMDKGATFIYPADYTISDAILDIAANEPLPYGETGFVDRQWMDTDPKTGRIYMLATYFKKPNEPASKDYSILFKKDQSDANFSYVSTPVTDWMQFSNIAIDNTGKINISYANLFDYTVCHKSSTNGGLSFSAENVVSSGNALLGVQDPIGGGTILIQNRENAAINMVVNSSGKIFAVWTDFDYLLNTYNSFIARSDNGGVSWTKTNLNTYLPSGLYAYYPVVGVYGDMVTVRIWGITGSGVGNIYMGTSHDEGNTFPKFDKISSAATNFAIVGSNQNNWFGDYDVLARNKCIAYAGWSDARSSVPLYYLAKVNDCYITGVQDVTAVNQGVFCESIYPIPLTSELINIDISADMARNIELRLMSVDGKIISNKFLKLEKGKHTYKMNNANCGSGIYILSAIEDDRLLFSKTVQKF